MTNRELGDLGETLAAQMLHCSGYDILEENWRTVSGEIDLIARDRDILVFVEVKLRTSESHGTPEEAVDSAKQARLLELAQVYLNERDAEDAAWRIDVIAITLGASRKVRTIAHYQDAVRYEP